LLSSVAAQTLATSGKTTLIDDRGFRTPICLDDNGNRIPQKINGSSTAGTLGRTPAGRPCGGYPPVGTSLQRPLGAGNRPARNRRLESVIGLAGTWYSDLLNGIIRSEAEYFVDELAFIPMQNLNPRSQIPVSIRANKALGLGYRKNILNTIPTADYLRWVIAY